MNDQLWRQSQKGYARGHSPALTFLDESHAFYRILESRERIKQIACLIMQWQQRQVLVLTVKEKIEVDGKRWVSIGPSIA